MNTPQTTCPRCQGSGCIQDDTAIGAAMRIKRQNAGITIEETAHRMGISKQYLSFLEKGQRHWTDERKETFLSVLK